MKNDDSRLVPLRAALANAFTAYGNAVRLWEGLNMTRMPYGCTHPEQWPPAGPAPAERKAAKLAARAAERVYRGAQYAYERAWNEVNYG